MGPFPCVWEGGRGIVGPFPCEWEGARGMVDLLLVCGRNTGA